MASRAGITRFLIGTVSRAPPTTASSWSSRRGIRASPKPRPSSFWNKAAASTSPWCTKTDMLRGFFLIFLLVAVAMVAFLGFRGQRSTGSPIELFPDMVRQMKVRAQAPLGFFGDNRGSRVPVAGTVPIGYELPQMSHRAAPGTDPVPTGPAAQSGLGFSEGTTDYYTTGKIGTS